LYANPGDLNGVKVPLLVLFGSACFFMVIAWFQWKRNITRDAS
jgi:hypothetical protein